MERQTPQPGGKNNTGQDSPHVPTNLLLDSFDSAKTDNGGD
uniref:Uncharacterized protein n=1 Tax=Arundo donax TaxID=35708 RepID=A0A0A8YGM3_ARUDO